MENEKFGMLFLRLGLGIVFLWAGFGKLFFGAAPPIDSIITFVPVTYTLFALGLVEFVLGVLLIFGLLTKIAGWFTAALLLVFVVAGLYLGMLSTVMSNVGLFGAALAVALIGSKGMSLDDLLAKK